ncbi:MAG TPA: TMF family protein [Mycobacterium sp.]|nr:TMF family protein [Mycobacterium sp.]
MSPLLNSPDDYLFAGAFVAIAVQQVWMVISGRLVPRSTVDRLLTDKDAEIAYLRETGEKLSETVDKLTAPARLAVQAIETLREQ